jgi:phage terminase Nu1 subunit (DNA packaging protein)
MDDLEGYCCAVDRLNRAKQRAQFRQEIADGLRVVAAAKAAGLSITAATIAGVSLGIGAPSERQISAVDPPRVDVLRINPKRKVVL